jgi:hypothetical protein
VTALTLPAPRRSTSGLVLRSAARGAVLVGLAVVIGIVLLQVVDKGGGGGGGGVAPPVTRGNDRSTTSTTGASGRPPSSVRVLVLNASGLSNAAGTKANELRGLGYAIAGTGNAAQTVGTTVACTSGFTKEADALAKSVGAGTSVVPYPSPAPQGAENADCIVTLGKAA